jgi:hypothetical protein
MSATADLTAELRKEVLALEDDLRSRVAALPDVAAQWRSEYEAARAAERTAASWEEWRDERVTLAAVAWVLTTVFVRFCEDNGLVKPVWITHAGGRGREATDAQAHFLRETARTNPDVTDREWLLEAVDYLKSLPATAGLVDETSPMWLVSPSGDAATRILNFWRERDDDGQLVRELTDPGLDTRFLGDVYQDISEAARKRYALLQTPVFVEEFILDRTLEPALAERPLEGFKAIDPTCGSGHFLLGIFARLLHRWHAHAPAMDERERVQNALDAVHGVDLNPFAVAVARFRLTVAALQACGMTGLEDAPAFRYHLAAGDSLLHGLDQEEFDLGADLSIDKVAASFAYATENLAELKRILRSGQYDCVVGNPPYIQVKDRALNLLYRHHYKYCAGKYALTVPFMERFLSLAKPGEQAGWTGQITSNSFMKREFGVALIEKFLPTRDLRYLIDVEGAWIPGHNMDGTPTVILVLKNQAPSASVVRTVMSKTLRETPSHFGGTGPYWTGMVQHLDDPGYESDYLSVADLPRASLASHPWSLAGGGAVELLAAVEGAATHRLEADAASIGITTFTLEDEVFIADAESFLTRAVDQRWLRTMTLGDGVRDWASLRQPSAIFPYDEDFRPVRVELDSALHHWMWPFRTNLTNNKMFGQQTKVDAGLLWSEYGRMTASKLRVPMSITFAFIATHNHFVLERGGAVFNRSAPVIKLPVGASEDSHLALLGLLNSSTACFWLKQKSQPKGGAAEHPWSRTYEFTGTTMQDYPLPSGIPLERGRRLDGLAQDAQMYSAVRSVGSAGRRTREGLDVCRAQHETRRAQMIAQQEELDWEVYGLYKLVDEDLTYLGDDLPELALGERAFEIVLARKMKGGEEESAWFDRHGSTLLTEIPTHWPDDYQRLVARRIELIESHPYLRLLEKPEHKRRWAVESWEKHEERALRGWLLDRLEEQKHWIDAHGRPTPKSIATLADEISRDSELVDVLAVWEGRPDVPVVESLTKLLAKEGVPYLAAYRYKESGLRKRGAWEHTWYLQRREDAGTYDPTPQDRRGDGPIPVPPKYATGDFARVEYWSHRGKLDLPKERFILYPNAGRETDPTPVLGWAGWDHAQQALALAILIQDRQDLDGWSDDQLIPLVAGLAEVLPWVEQWHAEPSDLYGGVSPAEFFGQQLEERMAQVSVTRDTLQEWRPAPSARGRKRKA